MERYWNGDEWTENERPLPPRVVSGTGNEGTAAIICGVLALLFAPLLVFGLMALRHGKAADPGDALAQAGRSLGIVGLALGGFGWVMLLIAVMLPVLSH